MRRITFATAAALLIGSSAAEAQIRVAASDVPPGHRPPPGMCRIWIDGVPPGRQPAPTDCATAQARAPHNSRIIYGDQTPFPGRGRNREAHDCRYERDSRPSLGEIIFGRRGGYEDANCRYDDRRQAGAWYEVGRDQFGNVIYQRTVRQQDGTVVVQRARRGANGRMVVFDTRYPNGTLAGRGDDDIWDRSDRQRAQRVQRAQDRYDRDVAKAQQRYERDVQKANGRAGKQGRKVARGNGRGNGRDR